MLSSQPIAIFLFELSTETARPWADAGYLCYCVDTQHAPGYHREGNIIRVGLSVFDFELPEGYIEFLAAFPPCTDLATSGARWFKGKGLYALADAIRLFARAAELAEQAVARCGTSYLIENPASTISTYWRKPDNQFDPCDYAAYLEPAERIEEAYTKRTWLWCGGGFVMPIKKAVVPILGSKMHFITPGPERANLRSVTARGFSRAVFEANSLKRVASAAVGDISPRQLVLTA